MIRNLSITLAVAFALGFVLGPTKGLVRCNQPVHGSSSWTKFLLRDSCVLSHHPSEARLLSLSRTWKEGVWPPIIARALLPWLGAGIVAGIVSGTVSGAAGAAALAVGVNFALFLLLSLKGGLVHGAELIDDVSKILSTLSSASTDESSYLRAGDWIGLGLGLVLATLGAGLGSIRLGRAPLLQAELEAPAGEDTWSYGNDLGASTKMPLKIWVDIVWKLARGDLRGAAVRLESGDHSTLALKLYRKAGQEDEAARLCDEKGMVFSAAVLYEKIGQPVEGAAVLERAGHLARAASLFEKNGRFDEAGRCFLRQGDLKAAADVYRRGGMYDRAAQTYLESGDYLVAARCYAKVGEYATAARIAEEQGACREASEYYERMRDWDGAAQCLIKAGDEEGAERMLLRKERERLGPPTTIEAAGNKRPGPGGAPSGGFTR